MAAIFQTMFWSAFSWMKMFEFQLKQIMSWRRPGDKPLSEPVMVRFTMHLYASLCLNEFMSSGEYQVCLWWFCGTEVTDISYPKRAVSYRSYVCIMMAWCWLEPCHQQDDIVIDLSECSILSLTMTSQHNRCPFVRMFHTELDNDKST